MTNRSLNSWLVGRRLRRPLARAHRRVERSLDRMQRAHLTAIAIRQLQARRPAAAPAATGAGRRSRLWSVGVGLVGVNALVVVLVLLRLDDVDAPFTTADLVLAILFGTVLASGQIAFAVAASKRLHAERVAAEFALVPTQQAAERALPPDVTALALVSTMVGWVIYTWTRDRLGADDSVLGQALAITLALQAWVAPWLLVSGSVAGRPGEPSARAVFDRRLRELFEDWDLERTAAALDIEGARADLHRAHHVVARAVELSGQPARTSWLHRLARLDEEIVIAEADYLLVLKTKPDAGHAAGPPDEPTGRDDVDLVG